MFDALSDRRAILDEPPRHPPTRKAPSAKVGSGKLRSLSGDPQPPDGNSDDESDTDIASSEGEARESDDPEAGDLESNVTLQAFRHQQMAEFHLQALFSVLPEVGQVVNDLVSTLRQIVPQAAAARLSSSGPAGSPYSASLTPPPPAPGDPAGMPPSGLMQLTGMAGMGGGMRHPPQQFAPPLPSGIPGGM